MSFLYNILGYGFVGSSLGNLMNLNHNIYNVYDTVDKTKQLSISNIYYNNLHSLITINNSNHSKTPIYFICVPTPSNQTGKCDTSIVENLVQQLCTTVTHHSYVIIKSTILPGTTEKLYQTTKNSKITLLYSPEFLREGTCFQDMYNAPFTLVGLPQELLLQQKITHDLQSLFQNIYKHQRKPIVLHHKATLCELFKYTINVFLAVKVWYFNEILEVTEALGENYQELQSLFIYEPRLGTSHTQVPGHDGKYGFGLSCLPKETRALKELQNTLGISNQALDQILERNKHFRKKKSHPSP